MEYGLPSGSVFTDVIGKGVAASALIVLLHKRFGGLSSESEIDNFLRGYDPRFALINSGDDNWIVAREVSREDIMDALDKPTGYALSIAPEEAGSFLGWVAAKSPNEGEGIRVHPSVVSYISNFFVPERGVDHPSRRDFWHIGWQVRRDFFGSAPEFTKVNEILRSTFQETYGYDIEGHYLPFRDMVPTTFTSDADKLVALNPEYIHYRIDPNDVSESVMELFSGKVDEYTVTSIATVLSGGTIKTEQLDALHLRKA